MDERGFSEIELRRKDEPDLRFVGRLIARADSRHSQPRRDKSRWSELSVYETRGGDWIAVNLARTENAGEYDFAEVKRVHANDPAAMVGSLMRHWGWSWLAKEVAREAGWDIVEDWS